MKLRLENLGRIKKAEIDIRPLTVFIGKNGTNKTWAAYALYGLAKQLAWSSSRAVDAASPKFEAPLRELATEIVDGATSGALRVDVERDRVEERVGRLKSINLQSNDLAALLGVAEKTAAESRVKLDLNWEPDPSARADIVQLAFENRELRRAAYILGDGSEEGRRFYLRNRKPSGSRRAELAAARASGSHRKSTERNVCDLLRALAVPNVGTARVLPSERKLLWSRFAAGRAEEGELAELGEVQADFARVRMLAGGPTTSSLHYDLLLERVLGGRIDFEGDAPTFKPSGADVHLPVEASASLVGALAGLDFYLRYQAGPGDFLIIDEPEMNAHPEAILGIAEVLAILANAGVNVVVTTHSPYLVDHLENLMDAAALPPKKRLLAKERMQLKDGRAFLKPEQLGVYLFEERGEHVEVKDVLNRKVRGIDWRTFSTVSDHVHNLRGELLELKSRAKP